MMLCYLLPKYQSLQVSEILKGSSTRKFSRKVLVLAVVKRFPLTFTYCTREVELVTFVPAYSFAAHESLMIYSYSLLYLKSCIIIDYCGNMGIVHLWRSKNLMVFILLITCLTFCYNCPKKKCISF